MKRKPINRCLLMTLGLVMIASLPLMAQSSFELKPVTPNVFLAVAADQMFIDCNSAVIILEDGVLVVDSQSTPAGAMALIKEIGKVTSKPIRWVVNSHLHWDHIQGNAAYVGKWPAGAEIISSETTRKNIERIGRTRVAGELVTLPLRITDLRKNLSKAPPDQQAKINAEIASTEAYLAEIRSMELPLPTLTFDKSLTIRRGETVVQLLFLGRGHTDGDVIVYLPNEKVVFTGDAVQGYAPYMGDCYPYDWIEMLDKLAELDFDYLLSGHGDILRGKAQIRLWQEFLSVLLAQTTLAVKEGLNREQTIERVSPTMHKLFESRFPPTALDDLNLGITKAWTLIAFQSAQ